MKSIACALWFCLITPLCLAQNVPPETAASPDIVAQREAAEHARIRATRASEEAKAAAQEMACYARFAVNDCLIDVRARKRSLLADLRRQEISLNDAARKRRAAEELLRSDERSSRAPS